MARVLRLLVVSVLAGGVLAGCGDADAGGGAAVPGPQGPVRYATWLDADAVELDPLVRDGGKANWSLAVRTSVGAEPTTIVEAVVVPTDFTWASPVVVSRSEALGVAAQVWQELPGRFDLVQVDGGSSAPGIFEPDFLFTYDELEDTLVERDVMDSAPLEVSGVMAGELEPGRCLPPEGGVVDCLDPPGALSWERWEPVIAERCHMTGNLITLDHVTDFEGVVSVRWIDFPVVPHDQVRDRTYAWLRLEHGASQVSVTCPFLLQGESFPIPPAVGTPPSHVPGDEGLGEPTAAVTPLPSAGPVDCATVADMPLSGKSCAQARLLVAECGATPGELVLIADTAGLASWQVREGQEFAHTVGSWPGVELRVVGCGPAVNGVSPGVVQADAFEAARREWGVEPVAVVCTASKDGVLLTEAAPGEAAGVCRVFDEAGSESVVFVTVTTQAPFFELVFAE